MKQICVFFCLLVFNSCTNSPKQEVKVVAKEKPTLFSEIHLIPLGKVNDRTIELLMEGVEQFYGVKPILERPVALTSDLLAKSGTRYEANKILKKFKASQYRLLITEKDIAIKYLPRKSEEWGILGLSYCPGRIAVISTFRIKKKSKLFGLRLQKVCNHELGHSLGLGHCNASTTCLMNDARGTMEQIDKEEMKFCSECERKIGK